MNLLTHPWPLITIAIPTLNQAQYIEQTLDSLLSQGYPRLNIMVLDGGSSDKTLEILERYRKHLFYFRSGKDAGPWFSILEAASKVNEGWFNWLNSDDFLLPGSLDVLASLINHSPDFRWITGGRLDVDSDGRPMRSICPWLTDPAALVFNEPFFPQDATFFRIDFFNQASMAVPSDLRCIFDSALHRAAWRIEKPLLTNSVFSAMRWHGSQITSSNPGQGRIGEYQRKDFKSISAELGVMKRLLRRALRTRYSVEISAILSIMVSRGHWGASEIKASVYWPWSLESKICSLAEAYSLYGR